MSGLGKVLQQALKPRVGDPSSLEFDFNTLVLPNTQVIHPNCIVWEWIIEEDVPEFDGPADPYRYVITGCLCTKGAAKGTYNVSLDKQVVGQLEDVEPLAVPISFWADETRLVGQALISAWNYHNVWKDHAGYFIEKEVMGED